MHYYSHSIGDYRRDTAHLSLLEHGIYRQLLDWYYLDEQPIPKETQVVMRRLSAKTQEEKESVINVLNDFFLLTENGYEHGRCDAEIKQYQLNADKNRLNGKKGGRPKASNNKDENPVGYESVILDNPSESQINPNHKPLTINHKPIEQTHSEETLTSKSPTLAASVCLALKKQKITGVNPSHPTLLALLDAGATLEEFENAAIMAKVRKMSYVIGTVKNMREQAASEHLAQGDFKPVDNSWRTNDTKLMAKAKELGIGTSGLSKFDLIAKIESKIEKQKAA